MPARGAGSCFAVQTLYFFVKGIDDKIVEMELENALCPLYLSAKKHYFGARWDKTVDEDNEEKVTGGFVN